MKKMIKLSLAAAVAVAGLTTTSSAADLSAAIKDSTVAGYVRYRVNTSDTTTSTADSTQATEAKAVFNFKTKVNDAVTANVKYVAVYEDSDVTTTGATADSINQANFIINTGYATLIAGLQTSQSPFFANNGDTRSNGLTALIPAGPVTIAAAHYINTLAGAANANGTTSNVNAAGIIGAAGPVNFELWAAEATNFSAATGKDADRTAILLSTTVEGIAISAHHATADNGAAANQDIENTQVVVSAPVGPVNLVAAYATTGKDSGDVTVDADTDSKLIFDLETIDSKQADADIVVIGASAVAGPVTLGVTYLDADMGTGNADYKAGNEIKYTVSYPMSKNFVLSGFFAAAELTEQSAAGTKTKIEATRVEAIYTF